MAICSTWSVEGISCGPISYVLLLCFVFYGWINMPLRALIPHIFIAPIIINIICSCLTIALGLWGRYFSINWFGFFNKVNLIEQRWYLLLLNLMQIVPHDCMGKVSISFAISKVILHKLIFVPFLAPIYWKLNNLGNHAFCFVFSDIMNQTLYPLSFFISLSYTIIIFPSAFIGSHGFDGFILAMGLGCVSVLK